MENKIISCDSMLFIRYEDGDLLSFEDHVGKIVIASSENGVNLYPNGIEAITKFIKENK